MTCLIGEGSSNRVEVVAEVMAEAVLEGLEAVLRPTAWSCCGGETRLLHRGLRKSKQAKRYSLITSGCFDALQCGHKPVLPSAVLLLLASSLNRYKPRMAAIHCNTGLLTTSCLFARVSAT